MTTQIKITKIMTYNQFSHACAEAQRTEGRGSIEVRAAHSALCCCEKTVRMTPRQVVAAAWKVYNKKMTPVVQK